MKSITSLAVLGLLLFACKACNFSGNTNRETTDSSPSPASMMYARDFIKPQLGRFERQKGYLTKAEAQQNSSGFAVKAIEQAGDAAAGEYESDDSGTVALMACSFTGSSAPASLVDDAERELKNDSSWRSVRAIPKSSGKRIEAVDSEGRGMVLWNNGHWLFMSIGPSISEATGLADNVGY